MLQGKRVTLRGVRREDLPILCEFNNDLEMEVVGGGDPPLPQSLERLQAELQRKDSVIAEITAENLELKKKI